ncbi:hypothetical protein GGP86_003240 [Salinibacter ruber]|jgi:hypothetical protein|uniref:hypothetical protein n=1 Tax=Salinibacter ruber TaxID=146919 RepID=UPI00216A5973|nr:hypothetical protein [Salinibacter ruber]MCS3863441.1 hypothetical protein [Salinibacter ruber]
MPNSDSGNGGVLSSAAQSKEGPNADQEEARKASGEDDKIMFNARVPNSLYSQFQEVCEEEGVAMSWAVRQYMRKCIENDETGHLK